MELGLVADATLITAKFVCFLVFLQLSFIFKDFLTVFTLTQTVILLKYGKVLVLAVQLGNVRVWLSRYVILIIIKARDNTNISERGYGRGLSLDKIFIFKGSHFSSMVNLLKNFVNTVNFLG